MKNLLSLALEYHWLIEKNSLEAIMNVLHVREHDRALYEEIKADASEKIAWRKDRKKKMQESRGSSVDGVQLANYFAFLDENGILNYPLDGEFTPRTGGLDALSGLQSYESMQEDFELAIESPSVKGVLLQIDSPGGTVQGIYETSDLLADLKAAKPLVTYVNGDMYSAAYWLGSMSDKVFASKSAGVGSIGVLNIHFDQSKKLEKAGIKPTVVRAGRYKADGMSIEPLAEETKDRMQAEANKIYMQFINQVASNRGLNTEDFDSWAEGRTFKTEDALKIGLIDEITTEQKAYDYLLSLIDTGQKPGSTGARNSQTLASNNMKIEEQLKAAQDENVQLKEQLEQKNKEIGNLKADIEAREKTEKESLIAQISEHKNLTASEKKIYEKCSASELREVLSECKASEEKKEEPKEEPKPEEQKEASVTQPAAKQEPQKLFVGAAQSEGASKEEKKPALSSAFFSNFND